MRYRQLDANLDMTFGGSQKNFLTDSPQAVAQAVLTALKLIFGEWYLDTTDGTPYFSNILGYHSQDEADNAIQARILGVEVIISSTSVPQGTSPGQSVPAVVSIEGFTSTRDPQSRAYSASCTINTIYGPTQLQIEDFPNF